MTNLRISESDALKGISPQELARLIEMGYADALRLEELRAELTEKFPRQWVAAVDSHIVGPAPELEELLTMLRERGFDPSIASVVYLDPDQQVLIL